jgi:hypothetical protein
MQHLYGKPGQEILLDGDQMTHCMMQMAIMSETSMGIQPIQTVGNVLKKSTGMIGLGKELVRRIQ